MRNGPVLAGAGVRIMYCCYFGSLFRYSNYVGNRETERLLSELGYQRFEK